jgi:hypothetical protein
MKRLVMVLSVSAAMPLAGLAFAEGNPAAALAPAAKPAPTAAKSGEKAEKDKEEKKANGKEAKEEAEAAKVAKAEKAEKPAKAATPITCEAVFAHNKVFPPPTPPFFMGLCEHRSQKTRACMMAAKDIQGLSDCENAARKEAGF